MLNEVIWLLIWQALPPKSTCNQPAKTNRGPIEKPQGEFTLQIPLGECKQEFITDTSFFSETEKMMWKRKKGCSADKIYTGFKLNGC